MQALVTGGAGFIGSNLVRALLDRGDEVRVLDDLSSGYRQNLDGLPRAHFVEGDVRNAAVVAQVVEGAEVVFHLAASVGNKRSIDNPVADAQVNLIGTLNLLEAMRRHGARTIVVSSSAGIFGELKTLPIATDHPTEPETPYGVSKLAEEKACLAYAKLYGFQALALRYFNVYGPYQRFDAYGNVIPIFAFQMLRGEPLTVFGDGEQTRDFVNVHDVVQANLKAAQATGISGAFNLGSGTRLSINRLVAAMQEASGVQPTVRYGPPRKGDVRDSLADISFARDQLGYAPTVSLADGLREYFEWARLEVVA